LNGECWILDGGLAAQPLWRVKSNWWRVDADGDIGVPIGGEEGDAVDFSEPGRRVAAGGGSIVGFLAFWQGLCQAHFLVICGHLAVLLRASRLRREGKGWSRKEKFWIMDFEWWIGARRSLMVNFGWKRGGSHQWLKFLPDHAEGFVMLHELGIDLGEFFEHIRMGHEEFPLLDESAHDMDAHFHGLRAV